MPSVIDILTCSSCHHAEELSFTMVDKQARTPQQSNPSPPNNNNPATGSLISFCTPFGRSFPLKQEATSETIKKPIRLMNKSGFTRGKAPLERLGTIQQQSSVQENVGWQQNMSEVPYVNYNKTIVTDFSSTAQSQLELQNSILRKEHQNLLEEAEVLKKEREFGWKSYMIKMAHAGEIEAQLSERNNRRRKELNELHGVLGW